MVPVVNNQGNNSYIVEFQSNPTPALTETLRQQTTELQEPELELQTKTEDAPDGSEADKQDV